MLLLQDPAVMRFLGPGRAFSDEQAQQWFDEALRAPSRWVIAACEQDELLGFCGVKEMDGVLDFGYFLRSCYWGQGIATQACRLALQKIQHRGDLHALRVFIADDNLASQGVAKKLGWKKLAAGQYNDIDGHYYRIVPIQSAT